MKNIQSSMFLQDRYLNGNQSNLSFTAGGSQRDVSYRCGACGYELNLSSSNRNTTAIGSKYGKSMKRGIISFISVDESRFTQIDQLRCIPYFISKHSWGFLRRKTKLLCRKCGNHVGYAYEEKTLPNHVGSDSPDLGLGNAITIRRKYDVKIRALQPSSEEESGVPLFI